MCRVAAATRPRLLTLGHPAAATGTYMSAEASGHQTAGPGHNPGQPLSSDVALDALIRFQEELNESQRRVCLLEQRMQLMVDDTSRVQAAERSLATALVRGIGRWR